MEPNLKTIAEYHGYRGDLPGFLLVLQENARLDGVGLGIVAKALEKHMPKDDVVKIALANQGNILPETVIMVTGNVSSRVVFNFSTTMCKFIPN